MFVSTDRSGGVYSKVRVEKGGKDGKGGSREVRGNEAPGPCPQGAASPEEELNL